MRESDLTLELKKAILKQLNSLMGINLVIDGNFGGDNSKTRNALRKILSYLKRLGAYEGEVDGKWGNLTDIALKLYQQGARAITLTGGKKIRWNLLDSDSISKAFEEAKKYAGSIRVGDKVLNLRDKDGKKLWNNYITNLLDKLDDYGSGIKTRIKNGLRNLKNLIVDKVNEKTELISDLKHAVTNLGHTTKALSMGQSSYDPSDLSRLVDRYAFDIYYNNPIDENYGISFNYTPHNRATGIIPITLKISNKYSEDEAFLIALGAGMENYIYNGKKYKVNLFKDSEYKDLKTFENVINTLVKEGRLDKALKLYNEERKRQFGKYNIEWNLLKDKTGFLLNNRYGTIPYGYNPESIGSTFSGNPALSPDEPYKTKTLLTPYSQVRYDPETGKGRFKFSNYDEFYDARMFGNPQLRNLNEPGISPIRAVTSTYSAGFPVPQLLKGLLEVLEGLPNSDNIDFSNYYTLTDLSKGSVRMLPWLWRELSKNPQASYEYLKYIFTHEHNMDKDKANKLAINAGIPLYHNDDFFMAVPGIASAHDLKESLKSFYNNAYNSDGTLKNRFSYTECGYDKGYDGGNYTMRINHDTNKFLGLDDWNIDFGGNGAGMNAGVEGRGIPLKNSGNLLRKGGKLIKRKFNNLYR